MPTPLSEALATLRRRHGDAVIRSGDSLGGIEAWPTGLPILDHRLTPGGLPVGRVSLLAAAPGASGRLTLLQALTAIASRERVAVYLDLVGSLDPGFLADLGADLTSLLVIQPPSGRWGRGSPWPGAWWRPVPPGSPSRCQRRVPRPPPRGPPLRRPLPPSPREPGTARASPEGRARAPTPDGSTASPPWSNRSPLAGPSAWSPPPPHCRRPWGHAASLTLECAADGWEEAHGDVLGLRTRLTVVKSKVSTPGETAALLLRYPRPFAAAEAVGRPAVVDLTLTAEAAAESHWRWRGEARAASPRRRGAASPLR